MDRRQFVASLGVIAGGGAAAMGTGAFSSVQAERDVSVSVADDSSAYLAIRPTDEPNGNYADDTGNGELAIDLSDSNGNVDNGIAGGEGLNTNALTTMADVFEVVNQGTQTVELQTTPLLFYDVDWSNFDGVLGVLLVPQNPDGVALSPPFMAISDLAPGDALRFGVIGAAIPESAIGSVEIDDEITFRAEADS
ncbi:hypothetical protein [Halomicrobium salinisoli]|uniref:hypothetical protein n=1 Tax=Halomicrobium salinisoli TaxID=2878391 RepID=UPI001CEFEC3A|nr:hypothetical protein [Halomicrobium salinisoli]